VSPASVVPLRCHRRIPVTKLLSLQYQALPRSTSTASSTWRRVWAIGNHADNIAEVYRAQGAYEKALQYYEEALDIRREKLGDRHPSVATTLNNIGWVHRNREDYSTALRFFREAHEIWREKLGDEHPWTKIALNAIENCESKVR